MIVYEYQKNVVLAKKRAEKKTEEEKAVERRAERKTVNDSRRGRGTDEYTTNAIGTDIKDVTQKVIAASLGTSTPTGANLDIEA